MGSSLFFLNQKKLRNRFFRNPTKIRKAPSSKRNISFHTNFNVLKYTFSSTAVAAAVQHMRNNVFVHTKGCIISYQVQQLRGAFWYVHQLFAATSGTRPCAHHTAVAGKNSCASRYTTRMCVGYHTIHTYEVCYQTACDPRYVRVSHNK